MANLLNQKQPFEGGELPPHLGMDNMSEMLRQFELRQVQRQFIDRLITLVVASLALITALAWDETLRDIFKIFFGSEESLLNKILYSVIITVLAVTISILLGKAFFKSKKKKQ